MAFIVGLGSVDTPALYVCVPTRPAGEPTVAVNVNAHRWLIRSLCNPRFWPCGHAALPFQPSALLAFPALKDR
jgi:hypothetical protein